MKIKFYNDIAVKASRYGNLFLVSKIVQDIKMYNNTLEDILKNAIIGGHIEIVKYVLMQIKKQKYDIIFLSF